MRFQGSVERAEFGAPEQAGPADIIMLPSPV